jgi:hypothetical protein
MCISAGGADGRLSGRLRSNTQIPGSLAQVGSAGYRVDHIAGGGRRGRSSNIASFGLELTVIAKVAFSSTEMSPHTVGSEAT